MEACELDSDQWLEIVEQLGGASALDESARRHKAFRRARGLRSAPDLLRLAMMYGPGDQSLRGLAAAAATDGVADLSDVALLHRLAGAADWLEALCAEQIAGVRAIAAADGPASDADRPIRIVDGSRLGADFKLHLAYDPRAGRIAEARITASAQGERLDRLAIEPGEIRLGDRGFPKPDGLRDTLAAGADVVLRVTWNSLKLTDAAQQPLDWLALFETATRQGMLDMPVEVHKAQGAFTPIPMRLVIVSKPPEAARRTRQATRATSRRKCRRRIDPRTLAGADHMVLITSLATTSAERLVALYGVRWQIELAFKRLKSILNWERRPAKDERLARAWLHAHLLFALLIDAAQSQSGALSP